MNENKNGIEIIHYNDAAVLMSEAKIEKLYLIIVMFCCGWWIVVGKR